MKKTRAFAYWAIQTTLLLIAIFLFLILFVPMYVYSLFRLWVRMRKRDWIFRLGKYNRYIAHSIDQTGNVVCGYMFDDIMIKRGAVRFGNPDETISSVLGKALRDGRLTWIGTLLQKTLDFIDHDHCKKAIDLTTVDKIKR